MKPIQFHKTAHDPQIDFIKGLCIIFVVWTHCMYREELRAILFPLFQIFYYATVSMLIGRLLAPVESHAVQRLLYIALSTVICLLPAMILYVNRQRQTH